MHRLGLLCLLSMKGVRTMRWKVAFGLLAMVLCAGTASANTVASSTMHFEGALTAGGGGIYAGTINMTVGEYYVPGGPGAGISTGGGYDVYALEGGCSYVQGYYGTGAWNCSGNDTYTIGYGTTDPHDAYPDDGSGSPPWGPWWDPDCADWNQYSLELTADHWYLRYTATGESPMSGVMDWAAMYGGETDLGTQDGAHGGSAAQGGGPVAWDWDCGWGIEAIPLELAGFDVDVQDLGGGIYHVVLMPADPEEVWVDDDFTAATPGWGVTHFDSIQDGIDGVSGSTVNVAAGTYREQLKIDASIDLIGAGVGASIIEAVDLIDRSTYAIVKWTSDSETIDPIIGVEDAGTVNISGFTIDGRELGPDHFYGIHYMNTDGSVTDCRIVDVLHAGSPGAQRVVSLVATHGVGGSCDVDFSDNVIPNFQKGGILVMGPDGTCTLDNNDIDNAPSDYNAGNGIQVSYGCTGTLTDNYVTGVAYTGEDWGATGILMFEAGDVTVTGGLVDQCEMGINYSQWNWVYTHTGTPTLTVSGVELDQCEWSVAAHLGDDGATLNLDVESCNIHDGVYSGIDLWGSDIDPWGGSYYGGWTGGTLTVTATGNVISAGDGIVEFVELAGNTVNVTANYNDLSGSGDYGAFNNYTNTIDATKCWWGDAAGPTFVPAPFTGPGMAKALPTPVLPFDEAYPSSAGATIDRTPGEGGRSGVNVSPGVDFDPWTGSAGGENIVVVTDPRYLTAAIPTNTVDVNYLGGGGGMLYGYSVSFSWDASKVTMNSITQGSLLTTNQFYVNGTGNSRTIDCVLLGDQAGVTGPGTMFTIEFTGTSVGTSPVDVTIIKIRDRVNADLPGFYEDDGELVVDVSNPTLSNVQISNSTLAHTNDYVKDTDVTQVTANVTDDDPAFSGSNITADLTGLGGGASVNPDTYAAPLATWNLAGASCTPADGTVTVTVTATDAIGNSVNDNDTITADNTAPTAITSFDAAVHHEGVTLSWDDPSGLDLNDYGVLVRYDVGGDYPDYVTLGTYPGDETGGDGTASDQLGAVTGDDHLITARDIYYYTAFAYDWALNYGPSDAGAQDRATNYWLGDVDIATGPGGGDYDGDVDFDDISVLSAAYWTTNPVWPANECDVGPTDDSSRTGIPEPDDEVSFEDLMIFAMNFNVVTPFTGSPPVVRLADAAEAGQPVLRLNAPAGSAEVGDELVVSLTLGGNDGAVKGASIELGFDTSQMQLINTQMSEALESGVFFVSDEAEPGTVKLDLAVLGTDQVIHGTGELALFTFRVKQEGATDIRIDQAELRGVGNDKIDSSTEDLALGSSAALPLLTRLVGAQPNPFNPSTAVRYELNQPEQVRLAIYDTQGRLVRSLVDGPQAAGYYTMAWDGRDTRGQQVGSGIYLIRMQAGDFGKTAKVVMLK